MLFAVYLRHDISTVVINGDASDLRFRDAVGVVVGLKAKGVARKLTVGGFVQMGEVA